MIEINLLPEELRKKQKVKLDFLKNYSKNIIKPVILIFISIHILLILLVAIDSVMLKHFTKSFIEIEPQKKQIDEVKGELQKYKNLEELFLRLSKQRLSIAPKLNIISDSLPHGIWLYELSFSKEIWKIQGNCISAPGLETTQIGKFLNSLKASDGEGGFRDIELLSIQRKKIGATEVVDFVISSKSRSALDSKTK